MKPWFIFCLAVAVYLAAASYTISSHTFLNGDEDINMITKSAAIYERPSSILEPDEAGRNNISFYLLLGALHRFFGFNPFYYYVFILFLHLIVIVLIMEMGRRLSFNFLGRASSALFFLVLSIHFQTIGWMENIGRVLMSILCLLSLIAFDQFRKTDQKKWLLLSWLTWFFALNAAEEAVVFPFLILIYSWFIIKGEPFFSKKNGKELLSLSPFFITQLVYFVFQYSLYGGATREYVDFDKLDIFPKIIGLLWSFANLVVPRAEMVKKITEPFLGIRIIIPAVIFIPLFSLVLLLSRRIFNRQGFWWIMLFSFLWFVISFSPYSLREMTDGWKAYPQARYLYWPTVGIALGVGKCFELICETIFSLSNKKMRFLASCLIVSVVIYFYALNVWTYCFMVDKLCRESCSTPLEIAAAISFNAQRFNLQA